MLSSDDVICVFEYIRGKIFSRPSAFQKTEKSVAKIDDFLKTIPDGAGESWLFDYMCLIFSRYSGTHNIKRIQMSWVIGDKGVSYFQSRTKEHTYYADLFKKENGLINPLIPNFKYVLSDNYSNVVRSYQNPFKCLEMGLFDVKKCMMCRKKKICRSVSIK